MRVRNAVVGAALALLGLGAGWGVGAARPDDPVRIEAAPVPASGPAFPRDRRVVIEPDPDFPALARNLPAHPERVGQKPFALTVRIPDGWQRTQKQFGEWGWFPPPGAPSAANPSTYNTYFMRLRLVGMLHQSVSAALDQRIRALEKATGVADFTLQSRSADTFVATYVADQHLRVTIERFIDSPLEPGTAFASIAVVGRTVDRDGMTSLLEDVTDSAVDSLRGEPSAKDSPSGTASASSSASSAASPSASASASGSGSGPAAPSGTASGSPS